MRTLAAVSVILLAFAGAPAHAQMQAFGTYKGKRLPISTFHDEYMLVIDNDGTHSTNATDVEVRPAKKFTDGFVEITKVEADLDPLRNASEKERTNPNAVRFRYRATLTADRSLSDCFGLLTFVSEGSVGTRLISIGHLGAGSAKTVDTEMRATVTSIGSLHVFSKGEEVRTSQHREPYDVIAYYADLVKNVKGLPAAELLKLEENYPHELSADGHLLATVRKNGTKKVMIVYDLDSMKLLSETPVAEVEDDVSYLNWVSDHQLAYIAEGHNYWGESNLYLLDIRTGKSTKLMENITNVVMQLPDRPEVLVLHERKNGSLFMKFDVLTGKAFDYEEPTTGYYHFDRSGTARVLERYSGTRRIYEFRPTPDSRWRDIDDLVKQPGLRFNIKMENSLDRLADIHSVGPDGDTLYISTRASSDRFELAAFSMSQGVIKQVIAASPKYDLTTADFGYARLLFAKRSPQLLGMVFEAQKPHVIWIDPFFAEVQKSVDATFRDHVNLPVDWSQDAHTFIYFSYSDQDPGTYYAFRPLKPELIPLLQLATTLDAKKLGKTLPFEFTARDGAKIPAYLTRPPTRDGGPPPLIVKVHGGPMARDIWRFDAENQFFASRGYAVLQVNYRGSSGYGAAFQAAGLRARLDTVILDDIADGVKFLIDQHEVDPHRIAVMGGSFGGWATYMCLIKYPELFRAGIAIAAVSSWKKEMSDDRWILDNDVKYAFWKALLARQNFAEEAKYIEPMARVAEIKQPVFIIHGERDQVVLPAEARNMLNALKKQHVTVEAKAFPSATHTYWPYADRVEMLNEIAGFLERNLPAATAITTSAPATVAKP